MCSFQPEGLCFSIFTRTFAFSKPALLELPPRKLFLFPMGHGHPILEMLSTTSPQHFAVDIEKTHLVVICHKSQGLLNSFFDQFCQASGTLDSGS